jgi:Flp pilus assembly protein TadG
VMPKVHRRSCRRTPRERRGATTVEFALTVPIFFLFIFAALEFARYLMLVQTASNAAFWSARQTLVPGATANDGMNAANGVLNVVGVTGGSVSVLAYTTTGSITLGATGGTTSKTVPNIATSVSATVSIPLAKNLWAMPVFCGTGTLRQSCTLTCDSVDSAGY